MHGHVARLHAVAGKKRAYDFSESGLILNIWIFARCSVAYINHLFEQNMLRCILHKFRDG
jgi:hypothetical protein